MEDFTRIRLRPQRRSAGAEMNLKEYLEIQSKEIERHKWIESEKAGKDLGMEAAIDWILKYADLFSDCYAQERKTS
jgi:hypothetical protein